MLAYLVEIITAYFQKYYDGENKERRRKIVFKYFSKQ